MRGMILGFLAWPMGNGTSLSERLGTRFMLFDGDGGQNYANSKPGSVLKMEIGAHRECVCVFLHCEFSAVLST